jgi:hypothetical protein
VSAELGFLSKNENGNTAFWASPLLHGWFRVLDKFAIEASWGFVSLNVAPNAGEADNAFRAGNPFLAGYSVRRHGCTELRIGIGATIPVATLKDLNDTANKKAYVGAMAMRGMWNWWLWIPSSINIVMPIAWDTVLSDHWIWGGSIAIAITGIFMGGDAGFLSEDTRRGHVIIPVSLKLGYRIGSAVLGAHLHSVNFLTGDTGTQLSLVPYTKIEIGHGFILARFDLNLDKPYGFAFNDDGYWGAHLGGGMKF